MVDLLVKIGCFVKKKNILVVITFLQKQGLTATLAKEH
jgi:hypothetical protein